MKNDEIVFPKKNIILSAIIAAVIFGCGGVFMLNRTSIIAKSAVFFAERGNYSFAVKILNRIDINDQNEEYQNILYDLANVMLVRGDYDLAYEKFCGLGDYKDSKEKTYDCLIGKAGLLVEQGKYTEAMNILEGIMFLDSSETLYNECQYNYGKEKIENDEWQEGANILWSIKSYKDAEKIVCDKVFEKTGSKDVEEIIGKNNLMSAEDAKEYRNLCEKRKLLKDGSLAVGFKHTVGLCSDGKVIASGSNEYGQCDTSEWKNVIQIAAGAYHTVALFSDGTVVACGDNTYNQCDTADWKNVVQVVATDYNTVGLLEDGTVVSCGFHDFVKLNGWKDINKLCSGSYSVAGIALNSNMFSTHSSFILDEPLIDVAMSTSYSVGLTVTGNIVYTSDTKSGWTKAYSVYTYGSLVSIIDQDYTVHIYDRTKNSFYDLPQDKKALSVALGGTHSAILYEDGSVYCIGKNDEGQCNTEGWLL